MRFNLIFSNVFIYGLLRVLATNLANFYEPEKIPQEFSQVGKNQAINYTRCSMQFLFRLFNVKLNIPTF